ncbi:single-stranded DNA-binding protein [Sphingobacterium sp. KU25419]|nr:single-stranded DNA-binding protein [Sphingobacterium sp. KU25419]
MGILGHRTIPSLFRFLLALRYRPTISLLSFLPFFLLENSFWQGRETKQITYNLKIQAMQIIGRITADAQVHTLGNDRKVVNFTVAENHDYKNKQTGEWIKRATFYRCAYWLTDKIAKALTKGRLVELTGRVDARAWTANDGETRTNLELHAEKIKFHDSGKKSFTEEPSKSNTQNSSSKTNNSREEDDLPF